MNPFHFAKILIIDRDDNVLLLRRSGTHPRRPYMPDLPGGLIEKGETVIEGLLREIKEETGIVVMPDRIIDPHRKFKQLFGLKIVEHFMYVLHLDDIKPDITLSWEHDQFSWVSPSEVKDLESHIQHAVDTIIKNGSWKKSNAS